MAAGVEPGSAGTVIFFPEGAFGPTNNCIGIADVMRHRGWRVVFIAEESFAGTFVEKGFEERLMRLGAPPEQEEDAGQFWKDYIRETAPVFRKPTIEQLEGFIAPTFEALIDGARYVDERLVEIIDEVRPDVIVEDNVVSFPALPASGVPWVRIVSCNPAEIKDRDVPPAFSGYPVADRGGWDAFREEYRRVIRPLYEPFNEFCRERGAPELPPFELIHDSPDLNLWLYPDAVDYSRADPLSGIWRNLESCVRDTDEPWRLPDRLATDELGGQPLVYLSLGSLGSGDVGLMRKLIDELADAPYRVIVSMGPQHAELELAPNMAGAEFLPQVSLLPEVDLVVTHGGNNTVTEALHFGKPMVVLPLFWDQYDNAQRIDETGFGKRLDTYAHDGGDLTGAIDELLADAGLADRLERVSEHLAGVRGTERAAELIAAHG
ncbi:MAG TPA: nucleotide disphospho-sugar-binding domain-containing protein [Solirubrobacterales bacterium]|nr:nucleotide disphospho-sugar-binding domain-containing protein [Solirubrobacterales bacterium]